MTDALSLQDMRGVKASFDVLNQSPNDRRHWAYADGLSADATATPEKREQLRGYARYEVANNTYAKGIVLTLANDTIGTGPRLQMLTENKEANTKIETAFNAWAKEIGLAEKLRTMKMSRTVDGESFAVIINNDKLKHDIQLDIQVIEADLVRSSDFTTNENEEDGIVFDDNRNPIQYKVLKHHPNDNKSFDNKVHIVDAENMLHLYRKDRAMQSRGVSEIMSALPLFANLRRYTLAVVACAETAANFSAVLHTDHPHPETGAVNVKPMETIDLERNMMLTLPNGWKMSQLEAKQPIADYVEFKNSILNEIARCLNMPFNIAAGNSSSYNYASGRLDHQTYYKAIEVDQDFITTKVLDKIFSLWLYEYSLSSGMFDMGDNAITHKWFWDGTEHVDPTKDANARDTDLANLSTNYAIAYARQGRDWEAEFRQCAREKALMEELGISPKDIAQKEDEDEEDKDDGKEKADTKDKG